MQNLLETLQLQMPSFSKGQRTIAMYIIEHYEKAVYMTASKLGAAVGVSESTVVRFASELGYEGYPQLQKDLQELTRSRLTSVQRMEVSSNRIAGGDVLEKVLNSDVDNIKRTLEGIDKKSFASAVDAIISAKNIYIIGLRSASSLASFLSFYFNLIFPNVKAINAQGSEEVFEQILRIGEGDVLITISFPRYSRRTVRAADYAVKSGAQVISITDSPSSPLAEHAHYTLLAHGDMASFVDSLVAPLSVINALILAVGLSRKQEVSNTFERLENLWDEYEVYEKPSDKNE